MRVGDALISRIGLAERETGVPPPVCARRLPTRGDVRPTSARSCVGLIPRFAEAARAARNGETERSRGGVVERGARGDGVFDRRVGDCPPFFIGPIRSSLESRSDLDQDWSKWLLHL